MSAYKDEKQGTWYVSFRYVDWTGEKKQKLKRGFRTKREALEYEAEFKRKASADMDMELGTFVGIYFEDKKKELKPNSIRNKKQMIQKHIHDETGINEFVHQYHGGSDIRLPILYGNCQCVGIGPSCNLPEQNSNQREWISADYYLTGIKILARILYHFQNFKTSE